MHHFAFRDGVLHAEGVSLERIAEAVRTPVYVYATATIERHYTVVATALAGAVAPLPAQVFFAVKANGNLAVLQTLARLGAGADVVSEGEIRKAMAAGIPPGRIVFSGVGKTPDELAHALAVGLYQINIESEGELDMLAALARAAGRRQAVVFRINPDIGAGGHAKITTGSAANKFGVSFAEAHRLYARAAAMEGITVKGLAVHIGSLILELEAMEAAFRRMRALVESLRAEGHAVERLDLGGGLGIPYEVPQGFAYGPDLVERYAAMVGRVTRGLAVELGFEPGRLIVGNAGLLLTRVLYRNLRADKRFLVVDAAMNDLVRPAMYDAYHEIWPVRAALLAEPTAPHDVVGPVCESSDTFAVDRPLPPFQPGDLMALMTAGAYGASMASTYNQRRLVPEVLVRGDAMAVTRVRPSYDDLLALDRPAPWL